MVKRIVIYGWIVPIDRVRGPGSGSLVDLIYFVDDDVSISNVITIIQNAGYRIIPKKIGNRRDAAVEADKVQIEDWENRISNLKVGSERIPDQSLRLQPEYYNRYSYPSTEI